MIDLTKLEVGDTVVLRCGGRITVDKLRILKSTIELGDITWFNDGEYYKSKSPFDIIAIEPKPKPREWVEYMVFRWGTGFERCKAYWEDADKHFKITMTEGKDPKIEEIK